MFSVVVFKAENCVECVPSSWIAKDVNDETVCYWPLKNAKRKIQKQELVDKERWNAYGVRIIGKPEYPDLESAMKCARKAEDTSNVDSTDSALSSPPSKRSRRPAQRFSPERSDSDISDAGPMEGSGNSTNHVAEVTLPSAPAPARDEEVTLPSAPAPARDEGDINMAPAVASQTSAVLVDAEGDKATPLSTGSMTDRQLLGQVLETLVRMEKQMEELGRNLKKDEMEENELLETYMDKKLDDVDQLNKFSTKCADDAAYRRKLVQLLAGLQGGTNLGAICRAMMRAIMTNGLMSRYSLTGQKGKLCFKETYAFRVILKAAKKAIGSKLKQSDTFWEVAEVLRNAPNQPGGINFEQKRRRTRPVVQVASDSD